MRKPGTYSLEELTGDIDGTTAYQLAYPERQAALANSWEYAQQSGADVEWVAEPDDDSDDAEIAMTLDAYALLVSRANTHCACCAGECDR